VPWRLVQESRAERDVAGHLDFYLERELFDTADRFIDVLEEVFHAIRDHPEIARAFETENADLRALGLRIWPLGHGFPHVLFYYPAGEEVRVFRVLHGAMDRDAELPG